TGGSLGQFARRRVDRAFLAEARTDVGYRRQGEPPGSPGAGGAERAQGEDRSELWPRECRYRRVRRPCDPRTDDSGIQARSAGQRNARGRRCAHRTARCRRKSRAGLRVVPINYEECCMMRLLFAWLALLAAFTSVQATAAGLPARPNGPVYDGANVIGPSEKQLLERRLSDYNRTTGRAIIVATVPSLDGQDIEAYA